MERQKEQYFYVNRVAEKLNCSKRHVYNLINSGQLKAVKIGTRALRIPESSLNEFLSDRKIDPYDAFV